MIIGDPYKLAFLVDRVPLWESDGFVNGIFAVCVHGMLFPPEIRTTTLNGDLFELLNERSPINQITEDAALYSLEAPALFSRLCGLTYPQDGDNDYRFLVPTREISDAGFAMFIIGRGEKARCLVGKVREGGSQDIQDIELEKAELSGLIRQLQSCYHSILKAARQTESGKDVTE